MSEPVITVKKETLDYLQNTGISQIMRDWRLWLNDDAYTTDLKERVFRDLNSAMYDSSASDIIEFYISGAYDFIPIEYTDNKKTIYNFPESKLKHFPKWEQELAKEFE